VEVQEQNPPAHAAAPEDRLVLPTRSLLQRLLAAVLQQRRAKANEAVDDDEEAAIMLLVAAGALLVERRNITAAALLLLLPMGRETSRPQLDIIIISRTVFLTPAAVDVTNTSRSTSSPYGCYLIKVVVS